MEQDITETPLAGFLEQNPGATAEATDPFRKFGLSGTVAALPAARMPKAELDGAEQAELEALVSHLQYLVKTRGIVLAMYIRQYDVTHRGVVTQTRFCREVINCFKDQVKLADCLLLAKAYGTADGQVRYMAVHRDITPDSIAPARSAEASVNNNQVDSLPSSHIHLESKTKGDSPNTKAARAWQVRAEEAAVDQLVNAIIRHVFERRIRVKDIFLDFDKQHLNRITRPQFCRAVAQLGVAGASAKAVDQLAERFVWDADKSGNTIAYRRFLEEVENAFTLAGLEKQPLLANETLARAVVTREPESQRRAEIDQAEEAVLEVTLANIKMTIVRVKAFNLRAGMRDFDANCEGYITKERFLRVLAIYGLVPELAGERAVLLKRYSGSGMRANAINYRTFLADTLDTIKEDTH